MIIVIHGDNHSASRDYLQQLITKAKSSGVKDITRLEGKSLDLTQLIQVLDSQSLFGSNRLVVIEYLFARPQSKLKKQIIQQLKSSSATSSHQIILWEPKSLTSAQLKSLGPSQNQYFKLPPAIFKLLEALNPTSPSVTIKLLDQVLQTESPELIISMLVRQVHLLLQIKSTHPPKIAPWQLTRLKTQARSFSSRQLILLNHQLLNLDSQVKVGDNLLTLKDSLIFFIASLSI